MTDYPAKPGRVYTEQIGLRVEPQLKADIEELKRTTDIDIAEAQRIVWRKLVEELKAKRDQARIQTA